MISNGCRSASSAMLRMQRWRATNLRANRFRCSWSYRWSRCRLMVPMQPHSMPLLAFTQFGKLKILLKSIGLAGYTIVESNWRGRRNRTTLCKSSSQSGSFPRGAVLVQRPPLLERHGQHFAYQTRAMSGPGAIRRPRRCNAQAGRNLQTRRANILRIALLNNARRMQS